MTTAEYAVGTAGVVCFAVTFCKISADPGWLTAIFDKVLTQFVRPWF